MVMVVVFMMMVMVMVMMMMELLVIGMIERVSFWSRSGYSDAKSAERYGTETKVNPVPNPRKGFESYLWQINNHYACSS